MVVTTVDNGVILTGVVGLDIGFGGDFWVGNS